MKNNLERKIKTSLLNEVILEAQQMQPAPTFKGKRLVITYIKQIDAKIGRHQETVYFTTVIFGLRNILKGLKIRIWKCMWQTMNFLMQM